MGRNSDASSQYQRAINLAPGLRTEAYDQLYQQSEPVTTASTPNTEPQPAPAPPVEVVAEAAPAAQPVYRREQLTVFITGATSGIGRATAEVFAREGHRLIITGRRAERLDEISKHLSSHFGAEVYTLNFDVSNIAAVTNAIENLPENWQDIDMLINNAGGAMGLAPIHEGRIDHWETMIDANIKGLLYVTRLISPGMVKRRKGHILNIGSTAGKETYPNGNVYCATKFAVDALTRAMRMDLYTHNIRVSQVSPGHVEETEFALTRFEGDVEKAKIYKDFQPLKSGDVAEVIYFIATRPAHVNIQDVLMMGTQQASSMLIDRSGR
ncbi:MAG: SDR family NAD(P)-dependent oxidoreductase [Saprospiraceae bacterium]|nr:SDR family NAD(P)-dependent oxidoreductase [Saprospiraceae bacterium]